MKLFFVLSTLLGLALAEYHKYEKVEYYKPKKQCYQCAYSPPQIYYDKKIVVEKKHYEGYHDDGYYGYHDDGYGKDSREDYGKDKKHYEGGYVKKTEQPLSYTVEGGWDKCKHAFTDYEAKSYGIDTWDCDGNCYVRKDSHGNIYRGCYKGEYGIDQDKFGCHHQGEDYWCFCYGDKCNNIEAPH